MRVKSYVNYVHKRYRWYRNYVGTKVKWYEFDPVTTTKDDVYDEGPERRWKTPFELPVMVVIRDEERETPREEGFYTLGTIHLTFGTKMAAQAGMTDPLTARRHLHDRFQFDYDELGRPVWWEVRRFQISGRLKNYEVVIGVDATQLSPEEFVNDPNWPPAG